MKKIIFFITVVVGIVAIGFVACNSLEKENGEQAFVLDKAAIEQVGVMHNQYLDTVLLALSKERIKLFEEELNPALRSEDDKREFNGIDVISKTAKDFCCKWNLSKSDELVDNLLKIGRNDKLRSANSEKSEGNINIERTDFQKKMYEKIKEIIYTPGISREKLHADILNLDNQIERTAPTEQDAIIMLSATTTVRYSYDYWMENASKWKTVLNSEIIAVIDDKGNYRESSKLRSTSTYNPCGITPSVTQLNITDNYAYEGFYAYPFCSAAYIQVIKIGDSYYAYLYICPEGLLWDDKIKGCNWPAFSFEEMLYADANGIADGASWGATIGAIATAPAGGTGAGPGGIVGGVVGGGIYSAFDAWNQYHH